MAGAAPSTAQLSIWTPRLEHFTSVFLVSGCVLGQVRRLVTKDRTKDRTKDSSAWAAAITRLVSGAGAGLGSGRSDKSAQH